MIKSVSSLGLSGCVGILCVLNTCLGRTMGMEAEMQDLPDVATPAERRRRQRPDGGTKPIDLTYLGRFTMGNAALESEILELFATHIPRYLETLRTAVTAKEWHDAAHTLKGAARGVGAWRISRCAETAERLRFDTDIDRRLFALDNAAEAVDEAIGYLRTLRR